jgi:hypothetical protein
MISSGAPAKNGSDGASPHANRNHPFGLYIYLDTYMLCRVYEEGGTCIRNHCGAEPPRDLEPPGFVRTVGGRDRAAASYDAADRVKAPARAARGGFRGVDSGCTATCVPAEARAVSGNGCLAGSVPPVLVRAHRCSRTPPRPRGSTSARISNTSETHANEKED